MGCKSGKQSTEGHNCWLQSGDNVEGLGTVPKLGMNPTSCQLSLGGSACTQICSLFKQEVKRLLGSVLKMSRNWYSFWKQTVAFCVFLKSQKSDAGHNQISTKVTPEWGASYRTPTQPPCEPLHLGYLCVSGRSLPPKYSKGTLLSIFFTENSVGNCWFQAKSFHSEQLTNVPCWAARTKGRSLGPVLRDSSAGLQAGLQQWRGSLCICAHSADRHHRGIFHGLKYSSPVTRLHVHSVWWEVYTSCGLHMRRRPNVKGTLCILAGHFACCINLRLYFNFGSDVPAKEQSK